jgi:hypothetical protein
MILILSRSRDAHVPVVTSRLDSQGAEYLWFDPADFPVRASLRVEYQSGGRARRILMHSGGRLDLGDVTAVWLRRPGDQVADPALQQRELTHYAERESRLGLWGVWESLDCLWLPGKPSVDERGDYKVDQLMRASALGFRIPRTLITNDPEALLHFYAACHGQVITKPFVRFVVRDGVEYHPQTHPVHRRDLFRARTLRYAPQIVQEYVPKRIELRITVVGDQVFAAEIHSQVTKSTRHDWRNYNESTPYAIHELPESVKALCLRLVSSMGLCYGAIDMVLTPDGEYVFLEINPNGQWAWVEDETGLPIADAITKLLMSGRTAPTLESIDALTV